MSKNYVCTYYNWLGLQNGLRVLSLLFDPKVVLRFKGVVVALLGILAAALGIWVVGLFGDYFEANPFYAPLLLTNALGVDMLGAVAPVVAAFVALLVLLKTGKASLKRFAAAFFVSVALAFLLCHITPEGLAGYPFLFALGSSLAAASVNVYPKPFVDLQKNFASTTALALACVPLSLFITDLAYLPYFSSAVIGGAGLTDGLLLSTLYAPLTVAGVFFALTYTSQMILLVEATRSAGKMRLPAKTGTVSS